MTTWHQATHMKVGEHRWEQGGSQGMKWEEENKPDKTRSEGNTTHDKELYRLYWDTKINQEV